MTIINKSSLVDQVYDQLRGEIISLQRPMGSKLNVSTIQEQMGVSCTPIREAINRLQQDGLIEYKNNIGAHVLTLREHDVIEIQELAVTLHCAATRLAMKKGERDAIIAALAKHLDEYRNARTVKSEVMAVKQFIGTFYYNCGNRRLDSSMISLQGQQLLLRHLYSAGLSRRGSDAQDFEKMLDCVRRGDTEGVCAAIVENADKATKALIQIVQNA